MRLYDIFIKIIICISIISCTPLHESHCNSGLNKAVQDALYFGTQKKDGYVTDQEWSMFLENTVTPRFPEGFNVSRSSGQWRGRDGIIIKENSYILYIVHHGSQHEENAVKEIIKIYKNKFSQEAVLRVQNVSCISF